MTKVIIDDSMRSKLHNLSEPLELCDAEGRLLARLTPVYNPAEYGPLEPQVSEEELKRRGKSDKWHSTAEVLAHLISLEM